MAQPLIEGIMVCPSPLGSSHAKENKTSVIRYYDVIGDYYNFQKFLQDDLIKSKSTSKIAVIFSVVDELYYSTASTPNRPSWLMYGITRALLKKQYEYDVRVLEFPEEIDIDRYDTFIFPHAQSISKKGRDFFSQLQEKENKKIIVFSKIGLRDEDYNDTKPVKLSEHVISLNLSPNEWLGHINTVDLTEKEKSFIDIITKYNSKITRINSEHSEKIITVTRKIPDGLMIHLLNFYIDTHLQVPEHEQLKKDKAHIFENLSITLNLPQKKEIEKIISHSPDSKLNVECIFKKNNNGEIELTVPRLEVWTVIKIKYKDKTL